jgi:hypothetical protein
MKIGTQLLKILQKSYAANDMIHKSFGRYDLAFKTDDIGRPVLLYIGKADEHGILKGEQFARRLQTGEDGQIIKDHWDNKGKV